MLRLLTEPSRLAELPAQSWTARRIRALADAWGLDSGLARFYADEQGRAFLSFEQDLATLFLPDGAFAPEAAEFLSVTAGEVLTDTPLELPGFSEKIGNCYTHSAFPAARMEGVTEGIQTAYELLSRVFPDSIHAGVYREWYADLSHRVRHGMSRVFTLPGICSGTLYCREGDTAQLCQIAVAPERRGEGWGRAMLSHLAAEAGEGMRLELQSRSPESDRFYGHLGFAPAGQWYFYQREPDNPEK